jgi:hypothetical protein
MVPFPGIAIKRGKTVFLMGVITSIRVKPLGCWLDRREMAADRIQLACLKFNMQAKRRHEHRSSVAVVARIVDVLKPE